MPSEGIASQFLPGLSPQVLTHRLALRSTRRGLERIHHIPLGCVIPSHDLECSWTSLVVQWPMGLSPGGCTGTFLPKRMLGKHRWATSVSAHFQCSPESDFDFHVQPKKFHEAVWQASSHSLGTPPFSHMYTSTL